MNKKWADKCATSMFTVIAAIIIAVLAGLIGYIFVRGLAQIDWAFLQTHQAPTELAAGLGHNYLIHFTSYF